MEIEEVDLINKYCNLLNRFDDRFPQSARLQQCLLFARFAPDTNLYAHPMVTRLSPFSNSSSMLKKSCDQILFFFPTTIKDFFPILDDQTGQVIHIDFAPHRSASTGTLSSLTTAPPLLDADDYGLTRDRIPPPRIPHEYLSDLMPEEQRENRYSKEIRDGLKVLRIEQPEGVSFRMNGNELEWQKWKMHIGGLCC